MSFTSTDFHTILQNRFPNTGNDFSIEHIGGGSINNTLKVKLQDKYCFCKFNSAKRFPLLFEKEQKGLEAIRSLSLIKVPEVYDCFVEDDLQVLILEWFNPGSRTPLFWKRFGEQLAAMHSIHNVDFGWNEPNYMGSVEQLNDPNSSWPSFFWHQRLQPLMDKCLSTNLLSSKNIQQFEQLNKRLADIFPSVSPSLVHGDLWSGNFLCTTNEEPVLIDPAVYYGHPSVDLGMTTLFGGFDPLFYKAYQSVLPFPSNYQEQWDICNLYPLLIHLYLFGSGYLSSIERTLKKFT
jgi:Fructosamine-3-kinase